MINPDVLRTLPSKIRSLKPGTGGARRRPVAIAAGLAVALTAAGGAVASAAHKSVELDVNGDLVAVGTFGGTVEDVLDAAGVELTSRDTVSPGLDAPIRDGSEIVVRIARPLEVTLDGQTETVWTTALSAAEALGDLAAAGRSGVVVTSRSYERTALELPLVAAGAVVVRADGTETTVEVETESDMDAVLALAGVTLGEIDRATLALEENRPVITVNRIVSGERTEVVGVPAPVREEADPELYKGQTKVLQEGSAGSVERTYRTLTVDGQETEAELVGEVVLTEATERVVAVGTKPRPAYSGSGVWGALAQCESGGNPYAVSSSGLYYGLYQFSLSTWASVGGSGLPTQASPEEQTQRAQILQARSGWGQWPHCAAKLGLI